jgi:hypothetical protein
MTLLTFRIEATQAAGAIFKSLMRAYSITGISAASVWAEARRSEHQDGAASEMKSDLPAWLPLMKL